MAKRRPANQMPMVFESTSPLAKQGSGPVTDWWTNERVNATPPLKKGINNFDQKPGPSNEISIMQAPLPQVMPMAWDRYDMAMDKIRPRYDGKNHKLPGSDK